MKASIKTVTGMITSIDSEKNEITVKEVGSGIDKVIAVNIEIIPSLKIDEKVSAEIKEWSNIADNIKKIE
ncbi:MAG: hypothetical protein V1933_08275 [Candidatus Omnitrophota bacterium]